MRRCGRRVEVCADAGGAAARSAGFWSWARRVAVCVVVMTLLGQSTLCQAGQRRRSKKWWWVSVAAVAGASRRDVASSRGGVETNPLLRGNNGSFNTSRALLLKGAAAGSILAVEAWAMRKSPGSARNAVVLNFATAGTIMGLAVRNWRVGAQATAP